jgi:restriction system protein
LLGAEVLSFGGQTPEGQLVAGVTVPWFEIIRHLSAAPGFLYKVEWRTLEEIIAGAFERDGWPEVVLTPRSNDKGRDVIATRPGIGSVRIVGQVKAYRERHVVRAEEVNAVCFTRDLDRASKAMVMTTSRFAPGILKDPRLQPHIPHQLELVDGVRLREWLLSLMARRTK